MLDNVVPRDGRTRQLIFKHMRLEPRPSRTISAKFKQISPVELAALQLSLKQNYFADTPEEYFSTPLGEKDLSDHLVAKLEKVRTFVAPWLNDAKPLEGSSILEIGGGTGCSTVALAEQGARVTVLELSEESLNVGKRRCELYGVDAQFVQANAADVDRAVNGARFDFIIFYASLEHMTHRERMAAMSKTWNMLSPGDLWCVIETPNRLSYYDGHTSRLPFYQWLPDDLAFLYSRFSPRSNFRELYRKENETSKLHFLRRGRGVSYHEFELAMKPAAELDVVSSQAGFLRKRSLARRLKWRLSDAYRFQSFLSRIGPKVHPGFYEPRLDLIIRKDG